MMRTIGSEFVTASEIFVLLNKAPHHMQKVLKELLQKLPIVKIYYKGKVVLLDSVEYLQSGQKIVSLMNDLTGMEYNEDPVEGNSKEPDILDVDEDDINEANTNQSDLANESVIEEIVIDLSPTKRKATDHADSGTSRKKRKSSEPLSKWKNPNILEGVKQFVGSSGLSANYRRRNETGEVGVSMPMVEKFVKSTFFPNDPDNAPSLKTLRRLFNAPHNGRSASKDYRGVINARLGFKRNDKCARELHQNTHHCFTEVKAAREFASKHFDDIETLSCDDKAKIPIGPPIVHRLVSLRKFFTEDQIPNLPDHDIRGIGLIVPGGYQILEKKVVKGELDDDDAKSSKTLTALNGIHDDLDDSELTSSTGNHSQDEGSDVSKIESQLDESEDSDDSNASFLIRKPLLSSTFRIVSDDDEEEAPKKDYDTKGENPKVVAEEGTKKLAHKRKASKENESNASVEDESSAGEEDESNAGEVYESNVGEVDESNDGVEESNAAEEDESNAAEEDESNAAEKDESNAAEEDESNAADEVESNAAEEDESNDSSINHKVYVEPPRNDHTQVKDDLGRSHVVCANTGTSFVFLRNNEVNPSTIARHVSDIYNLLRAERTQKGKPKKAGLVLILDDGQDYGMKSLSTVHCLGKLFLMLDLDILMIVKNSPGCSRFNPIEHFWGFITPKLAGKCLPTKIVHDLEESFEDDKDVQSDSPQAKAAQSQQSTDQDGDKNQEDTSKAIVDQGSKIVSEILENLIYDGFEVVPVQVKSDSENIKIRGDDFVENKLESYDEIEEFYHSTKKSSTLKEEHPKVFKVSQFIYHHADCRTHSIYFRKCREEHGDVVCARCKKHPPRGSQVMWNDLPKKASGGLFYSPVRDEEHPGHHKTLLNLISHPPFTILPDNLIEGVKRCEDLGCHYIFKSVADQERHLRIVHGKKGKDLRPEGFKCMWVVNGAACGELFATAHYLNKHKISAGHKTTRKKTEEEVEIISEPEED